jgi:hypothetical protein
VCGKIAPLLGKGSLLAKKEPMIVLEAVATYDQWIQHAFLGMPS